MNEHIQSAQCFIPQIKRFESKKLFSLGMTFWRSSQRSVFRYVIPTYERMFLDYNGLWWFAYTKSH